MTAARYLCRVRCRRCRECQRVFRPSSRHIRCPSCPSRDVCECGRSKQVKSATCGVCRRVSAEANGNWKGGRTRHKPGYVMVRAPGHPRSGQGNYVSEHILVAEELLGRFLTDGETVHHRNGVCDDNRPENLELWTWPQPSGIGVSDAVDWARHILGRYEGVGAPPTTLTISRESPWRWRESNVGRPYGISHVNGTVLTLPWTTAGRSGTPWDSLAPAGMRCLGWGCVPIVS
jgi:ribosomal protein S27E